MATRKTQKERREAATQQILDAAEAEFAANGFDGVSLASVAQSAGLDTAHLRYYFKTKQELFENVVTRRSKIMNELRERKLRELLNSGEEISLAQVIDIFVRPGLENASRDEGWRNHSKIISYVNSSAGELERLMSSLFDQVALLFIDALRRVFPDASEDDLFWSYNLLSGAYTFCLGQTMRIDRLSDGRFSSADLAVVQEKLPQFVAAGITQLCTRGMDAAPGSK